MNLFTNLIDTWVYLNNQLMDFVINYCAQYYELYLYFIKLRLTHYEIDFTT